MYTLFVFVQACTLEKIQKYPLERDVLTQLDSTYCEALQRISLSNLLH